MKKIVAVVATVSATLLVSTLYAQITPGRIMRPIRPDPNQQPPAQAPQAPGQQAPPVVTNTLPAGYLLIKTLDTNHNAIIEAAEINNAPEALKKLDLNGDGRLTEDEYLAKDEPHPSPSPLLRALDLNKDGIIDAKELAGAPAALRMLDKNFDGKLAPSEYRPAPGTPVKTN